MMVFAIFMVVIALIGFGGLFLFLRFLLKQNPSITQDDQSSSQRPVQAFFDIKGIDRGILVLSNGRYRVAIEGDSLNVPLMSEEEQGLLESRYASLLARMNFSIQQYNQTRPLDMEEVVEQLADQYDNAPELLQNYAENLKFYLANLSYERPIWVRRKLIILPFDDPKATMEQAISVLDQRARLVLAELHASGIQARCLNTEEITQVWYTFLNKDRVLSQPFRNTVEAGHTATAVRGDRVAVIY